MHPQLGNIEYGLIGIDLATANSNLPTKEYTERNDLTIGQLYISAQRLDRELYDALWWNDTYGFASGIGVFVAGVASAAFGVFDTSRALLLSGGLATATFSGVRSFYPFAERNELYAKGRTALQCVVQSVDMALTAGAGGKDDPLSLVAILNRTEQASVDLRKQAAQIEALPVDPKDIRTELVKAMFVEAAEKSAADLADAVSAGRIVASELNPTRQAAILRNAIERIHVLVDEEATALSPRPDEALKGVRTQLVSDLTAIKTSALQARELARGIDNQKTDSLTPAPTASSEDALPSDKATPANEAAAKASLAANTLEAKMTAVIAQTRDIDTCMGGVASDTGT